MDLNHSDMGGQPLQEYDCVRSTSGTPHVVLFHMKRQPSLPGAVVIYAAPPRRVLQRSHLPTTLLICSFDHQP